MTSGMKQADNLEPVVELAQADKLELAKGLVTHLESDDENSAAEVIAQLAGFGNRMLFMEVGRLARELHESIKDFMLDERIVHLANTEMPDAAERLRYVITMTEQAANTTLSAVEGGLPIADQLNTDAKELAEKWRQFNSRELTVDDFRLLSEELQTFLDNSQSNATALHDRMSEVLMAQGFQDLTGQIIRKVIALVGDVETKLVELVRISGRKQTNADTKQEDTPADPAIEATGPNVPGVDKADVVSGQDDVDDLLSSLGF